jgi:hypothetical protein
MAASKAAGHARLPRRSVWSANFIIGCQFAVFGGRFQQPVREAFIRL